MTYKDRFVVEVKLNGQILRVRDGFVTLPFGSEYSILLKNLNSQKASVRIHIDGQDVLNGSSLIIGPNQTTELEGFLNGTVAKNKFKFIKKTKEISNYRGDRIDDGLIRVEFAFEKPPAILKQIINEYHHHHYHYDEYNPWKSYPQISWTFGDCGTSGEFINSNNIQVNNCSVNSDGSISGTEEKSITEKLKTPIDDMGITVKGSEINQQFMYGSIGELETPQVIVIQLKGKSGGVKVKAPITTRTKLTCSTCGRRSKSSFKFCPNCGTFLE
ncbi:MAG: zinc ribbon domain-containing protein [Candidatus Thorarchaeota archaeon]|jgi:hypothetical protein